MYLDHSKRRIEELGCVDEQASRSCTEEEVTVLEEVLGFRLPGAYRELLLWCGKGLGSELSGLGLAEYEEQVTHNLRLDFQQSLEQDGHDPTVLDGQTLILEYNCDGYFSFLRAPEGNDPPLYLCAPDSGEIACCCERFSDYFALLVENGLGPGGWEYLKQTAELEHLPPAVEEISGLLFWGGLRFGTVPERVFDLKDLRYLNLVGKGLTELSPRISELVFLKRLDLARNSLTSLPAALAELDELEDLDLADNQLSNVLDVLRELPRLRSCALAGNRLPGDEMDQLRSELPSVEFSFFHPDASQ
jgi:hypothetical protein